MFHYIKGTFEDSGKDYIIIDNNGIGYKIYTSSSTISRLGSPGREVQVFTYFHVREDTMALYGFLSKEELNMFELLISVSGVGPKAGLVVLSAFTPAKLTLSILGGDVKSLTSVSGIGSKTANRIVLELKDKIDEDEAINFDVEPAAGGAQKEAVNALISLGYSTNEASNSVGRVDPGIKGTENIIKAALKNLMK